MTASMGTRVMAAYAVISIVWGSTYLAIRIGVQHLPPALFGGIRFVTAGTVLLVFVLATRRPLPSKTADWATAALVGVMLLGIGNGLVIWAERSVESSMAALVIVTSALWMAIFDAVIPGGSTRPTWRQFAALLLGFGGTTLLVGAKLDMLGASGLWGPVALVVSSASWALGSIISKRRPSSSGPYANAALQMLAGGGVLLLVGLVRGEAARLTITPAGVGATAYLIVFGSIVAYTSYVYLLQHASPAFVGTGVYVNTVVAVTLGWVVLGEAVTPRTFVAMVVILGSVAWVRKETGVPARPAVTGPDAETKTAG
jgi:drug/metabolite transporter (DMT)-like permease